MSNEWVVRGLSRSPLFPVKALDARPPLPFQFLTGRTDTPGQARFRRQHCDWEAKGPAMHQRGGFVFCALCAAVGGAASRGEANPQAQPGYSHTIIQKTELPGDKYVCLLVEVEIEPNAFIASHTHPGIESSFIVSGSSTLSVMGQPDRLTKAGDSLQIPPEVPHRARNGPDKSRVIATYTVEKDKPLSSPAPA